MSRQDGENGWEAGIRPPAVAGTFYPAEPETLGAEIRQLLDAAREVAPARGGRRLPAGILVPHAGLSYSGLTAAAAWGQLPAEPAPTVVLLGTNHGAGWLTGVGAWEAGAWRIPTGDLPVDAELAEEILAIGPPFEIDREAHALEHSIEVQLPLLAAVAPAPRIVPLAVSAGRRARAVGAGRRLGSLLGEHRAAGAAIVLAISTDVAHYPTERHAREVTEALLPSILAVDPAGLADHELAICATRIPGLACGMCGIEPAVLGLAALREMGATSASVLASATSADAGGPPGRTVGYLSVRFDTPDNAGVRER